MIYMVDNFTFRLTHYYSMHPHISLSSFAVLNHPQGVESSFKPYRKPFIPGQFIVILRVHYREFSLRKGYLSKGVAAASFPVPKHYPYAQPEDKLRQIDFNLNRSQNPTKTANQIRENSFV